MAQLPDREIRLASAALLFARDAYPHLEMPAYLARLEGMAERVDRLAGRTPLERLSAIRRVVCEESEFRGNAGDYFDPKNSYLNEVMDRRRGIPISLSAIWLDIAHNLRFPMVGVNFPGHFLIRYEARTGPIYLDAFAGGEVLSPDDLRERLCGSIRPPAGVPPEFLATAGTKAILMRMLNNLLGIYLQQRDWPCVEPILARQVALCPDDADLWCRRGLVYMHLQKFKCAVACLERSLDLTGCHPDSATIKRHLEEARRRMAESN